MMRSMESHPPTHQFKAGISYILVAWLFFTVMTIMTRYTSATVPIATILLIQNIIGLLTLIPWVAKHGWGLLKTEHFGLILFRSLVSLIAIAFSYLAIQRTSLTNTMLFNNASPLWIPFVVLLWRKIPINHILWPGLIGGFIGIVLILQPSKELIHIGSVFALIAGVLQSVNMVSVRVLSYTERNHTVMFYYFLICSLACLPISLYEWAIPGSIECLELAFIGIFFALGQWCFVRAFNHAKASQLGPFNYSAVVFAVLIDWIFFGQIPDILSWIGIALVCAGGIWAIRFNQPVSKSN
jgi:drug/metabolite transporter (DMT)-like permease